MSNTKIKKRLSRWFKLRFAVLYPFGIWAIISGYSTEETIKQSIWFIILGLGIRSWANLYAIKMEKLTTNGPYAYIRHPLYLGSFLIMTGFLIMLNINWIGILVFISIVILTIYKITVQNEEKMLANKFGKEYAEYQKSVPAFFFTFTPFKKGEKWPPSIKRYFKSQEYKLLIWVIILIIAFHIKEELIIEQEPLDTRIVFLFLTALALGLLDILGELVKKKSRKAFVSN